MELNNLFSMGEYNEIITARMNGVPLDQVANLFNTTREIIRALESRYLRIIGGIDRDAV